MVVTVHTLCIFEKIFLDMLWLILYNECMFDGDTLCLFPDWMIDYELEEKIKATYIGFPAQIF